MGEPINNPAPQAQPISDPKRVTGVAGEPPKGGTPNPVKPAAAPAAPPPTPPPNPLPEIPLPFQGVDFAAKGIHAEAIVEPGSVVAAAREMDKAGFSLDTITGLDWLAQGQMELVYDFFHPLRHTRAVFRARIPRDNPEIETISAVYPGANWHERETHDFFGIVFKGHPDLSPFLLPEDADYHPLRKDYAP
jgi:NADH-quinone oxidoreductase subunit C